MSSSTTPRRRDARRNREALVAAARSAFGAEGEATLESIAKAAGVGIGTLYRHFPTREALVEAVYHDEVARLSADAEALLHRDAPDVALRAWMDSFAQWIATKRGMTDTLRALVAGGAIDHSVVRDELTTVIGRFLDAGAAAGVLRGDVAARDVLASITGVFLASGNDQQAQAARMLDLLLDGLRPRD